MKSQKWCSLRADLERAYECPRTAEVQGSHLAITTICRVILMTGEELSTDSVVRVDIKWSHRQVQVLCSAQIIGRQTTVLVCLFYINNNNNLKSI